MLSNIPFAQAQKCFAPEVCCRLADQSPSQNQIRPEVRPTQRPLPATPPQREALTSEGYVITVPQTKLPVAQTTARPYQPPAQTPRPTVFKGEEYIPPQDNHIGSPSNERPVNYLPPVERGEDLKSEPIEREPQPGPSNDVSVQIRPNRPSADAPAPQPPTQCPAATNCTEIEYCTAQGVISKEIVQLSPEQQAFRVPLSDCRSLEKGYIGKCCRDPDYVDPWPVGILGQYNASILGFDDGSYKPPSGRQNGPGGNGRPVGNNGVGSPNGNRPGNGGPANRPNGIGGNGPISNGNPQGLSFGASGPAPVRGQGQLSLPIATIDGSQSQTTFTRTPFPQAVTNQLNYQRQKDTPYTVEPIASGSGICAVRDTVNIYSFQFSFQYLSLSLLSEQKFMFCPILNIECRSEGSRSIRCCIR